MSDMRALRLVLAVVLAVLVLRAVPAYSSHVSVPILALAIDPLTPTTLYAGTPGGVFKSTDGGASWSASGLINISALAIDPLTPTTLYAGSAGGEAPNFVFGGVVKSTDGGASWSASGLGAVVSALAIDPLTPTVLYAGTLGYSPDTFGDLYKSTDGGASWSPACLFCFARSSFCGPCGGVSALVIDLLTTAALFATEAFTSYYEDGLVAYAVPASDLRPLAIDPLTPTTRYAGTSDAVYKSTDGGASWNATGLTGAVGVESLAIDPLTPTTLYAGTSDTVYKSTDGGVSWNATGLAGVGGVQALAIDPLTPTTLYAATGTSGVHKSTNSGVSWNPTGPIAWSHISSVSLNPTSVVGGSPSTGTVTLSAAAPAGGAVVELATGDTNIAAVPTRVTVAAGATSADFMVSTSPVTASIRVLIWGGSGGGTSSTVLTVTPTPQPPVANFTSGCSGLTCSFDGSSSSDPDGTITGYSWNFGDGTTGSGPIVSHTYAAAGTYTVKLTVTDNAGATGAQSKSVTASQAHVGDLDGASTNQLATWTAVVTITVHDSSHSLVADATVSGSWSGGGGTGSCTTNGSGQCTVSKSKIPKRNASVVFTVVNVTHATLTYASADNHDPDGDSNGSNITVSRR